MKCKKDGAQDGAQMKLFSPGGSHASPSPQQEKDKEATMTAISGQKLSELLDLSNPASSYLKTFLASQVFWNKRVTMKWSVKSFAFFQRITTVKTWLKPSSESIKEPWGLSSLTSRKQDTRYHAHNQGSRSFCVFQLRVSVRPIDEIGFGLLHTPNAQEPGISAERLVTKDGEPAKIGERAYDKHTGRLAQVGLIQQVQIGLLPTPTTQEPTSTCELTETGRRKTADGDDSHSLNLGRLAGMGLLPTPRKQTANAPSRHGQGGMGLQDLILLPTPTATSDAKGGCTRPDEKRQNDTLAHAMHSATAAEPGTTSQLNPRFVGEMMGFPPDWTELPFLNGETNQSKPMETP